MLLPEDSTAEGQEVGWVKNVVCKTPLTNFVILKIFKSQLILITLPETNIGPTNGWLEYDPFLLGFDIFSGAFAVSFREGN